MSLNRTTLVTGVESEANMHHGDMDTYFSMIVNLIKSEPISERDRDFILRNIKNINYFDKSVIILTLQAGEEPSIYGNDYHVRHGSSVQKVEPTAFSELFRRFQG
jgi:thioredoxin reductase